MSEKQKIAENKDMTDKKEAELLYGAADQYGIYQLKDDPELTRLRFKGTWTLKQAGILKENAEAVEIKPENYDLVYVGDLSKLKAQTFGLDTIEDTLHALFEKFNIYQPQDYTGNPLSVSDVVVLREDGKSSAHYVDSTDYTELSHFIQMLENRQEKDRIRPEGRTAGKESLKEKLARQKHLTADEGRDHPIRNQKKEMSL